MRLDPNEPSPRCALLYLDRLDGQLKRLKHDGQAIAEALHSEWTGRDAASVADADNKGKTAIERARAAWSKIDPSPTATIVVNANAVALDEQIAVSVEKAFGVNIERFLEDRADLAQAMKQAVRANVSLIKSIPEQYLDLVEKAVSEHWTVGTRWETLAARIAEIGHMTDRRAELIARDQTAKLGSAFEQIRHPQLGIEQYEWSDSHDKRVRHSHHELDGHVIRYDAPPYVDGEYAHAGEPVNCFPGDSEVQFAHNVSRAFRREYRGVLAEIVTASGRTLRATPNHPVLTSRGWLPIGQLNQGDYVIEVGEQAFEAAKVHHHDRVPLIAEVFEAATRGGSRDAYDLGVDDFHGDGAGGNVDVVLPARPLSVDAIAPFAKGSGQLGLSMATGTGLSKSALALIFKRMAATANGLMGRIGEALSTLWRKATHSQVLSLAYATASDAGVLEAHVNNLSANPESSRNRLLALAGEVVGYDRDGVDSAEILRLSNAAEVGRHTAISEFPRDVVHAEADELADFPERLPFAQKASRVVKARRINGWRGHVYNLETAVGWYVTNGIVAHNCRCARIPMIRYAGASAAPAQYAEAA